MKFPIIRVTDTICEMGLPWASEQVWQDAFLAPPMTGVDLSENEMQVGHVCAGHPGLFRHPSMYSVSTKKSKANYFFTILSSNHN